ncbi:PAPS reductase-like domain protein [Mycobacterium phage Pound]|nr:PAPS reductase-like domain protein [Mycobacterium phage Pound]
MAPLKHVVMFSGGVGSWATAKRVAALYGTENLTLLFADVGGKHTSPHAGEDEDCYRFIEDAHKNIGGELVILNEGRDIWEVFKDNRFLGNSRLANCSKFLKQQPCREWLDANCDPENTAVYVGIDWSETHRIPAIENAYLPYVAFCPMTEPPYLGKEEMLEWCREEGLEPPRMYAAGFPHANCGGGCVRAGHGQFKLLYEQNPERFSYWEQKEQELRDYLEKDVAILRDRRGGKSTPLPLSVFRRRLEGEPELVDADDIGGCGCFVDEPAEFPTQMELDL